MSPDTLSSNFASEKGERGLETNKLKKSTGTRSIAVPVVEDNGVRCEQIHTFTSSSKINKQKEIYYEYENTLIRILRTQTKQSLTTHITAEVT